MDTERRRQKRRRFTYYMPVVDADTLQLVGHLSDISPIGIKVDSDKPLPVNMNYRLRVDLGPDIAMKTYMVFNGRSRWCQMDRLAPNTYNVGFEVRTFSQDDAEVLMRMYEHYGTDSRW